MHLTVQLLFWCQNNLFAVPVTELLLFIPHHTIVAGYYVFTLDVRVSIRLSVEWMSVCLFVHPSISISFPDDNLSKHQWIFTKLVCALILWISDLGLLTVFCHGHDRIFVCRR